MSLAVNCIATPITYAEAGLCSLRCDDLTGTAYIYAPGIEIAPQAFAWCNLSENAVADSVCVVRCVSGEPVVEVVPEPGHLAFVIGLFLVAVLAKTKKGR